jgi:transposase InsO family protein
MDYLTKWPEVVTLPDSKAKTVAQIFIEQVVCCHSAPEVLLLDQGQQFLSKLLCEINEYLRVKKCNTTAYHPQTDGLVEQFNGTLEGMLAKLTNEHQDDWDIYVPYVLFAYRTSVHEATGDSPFYMLYGVRRTSQQRCPWACQ